jgi:hypothetical protein
VKRAYAALLKKFRPDVDPEGFQRIHAAYQSLLALLEGAGPAVTHPIAPPESETDSTPGELREGFTLLSLARSKNDRVGMEKAMDTLSRACESHPELRADWARLLARAFPEGLVEAGVADTITAEDILAEANAGSLLVARQIVNHWTNTGNLGALVKIGRAASENGVCHHPNCGVLALQLALAIAMRDPGGASCLINVAFRLLPPPQRDAHIPGVENLVQVRALFWHLKDRWKGFWETTLEKLRNNETIPWDEPKAHEHLVALTRETPPDWPGWELLHQILPPLEWSKIILLTDISPMRTKSWFPADLSGWSLTPEDFIARGPQRPLLPPPRTNALRPTIPSRRVPGRSSPHMPRVDELTIDSEDLPSRSQPFRSNHPATHVPRVPIAREAGNRAQNEERSNQSSPGEREVRQRRHHHRSSRRKSSNLPIILIVGVLLVMLRIVFSLFTVPPASSIPPPPEFDPKVFFEQNRDRLPSSILDEEARTRFNILKEESKPLLPGQTTPPNDPIVPPSQTPVPFPFLSELESGSPSGVPSDQVDRKGQ